MIKIVAELADTYMYMYVYVIIMQIMDTYFT